LSWEKEHDKEKLSYGKQMPNMDYSWAVFHFPFLFSISSLAIYENTVVDTYLLKRCPGRQDSPFNIKGWEFIFKD
jgi:hypothetical protein